MKTNIVIVVVSYSACASVFFFLGGGRHKPKTYVLIIDIMSGVSLMCPQYPPPPHSYTYESK